MVRFPFLTLTGTFFCIAFCVVHGFSSHHWKYSHAASHKSSGVEKSLSLPCLLRNIQNLFPLGAAIIIQNLKYRTYLFSKTSVFLLTPSVMILNIEQLQMYFHTISTFQISCHKTKIPDNPQTDYPVLKNSTDTPCQ